MARTGQVAVGSAGPRGEIDEALWAKKTFEALGRRFIGSRRNDLAPATMTFQVTHRAGGNDDELNITHVESGISTDGMLQAGLFRWPPKVSNLFVTIVQLMDFVFNNHDFYTPNGVEDERPAALKVRAQRAAIVEKVQAPAEGKPELYVKAKPEK